MRRSKQEHMHFEFAMGYFVFVNQIHSFVHPFINKGLQQGRVTVNTSKVPQVITTRQMSDNLLTFNVWTLGRFGNTILHNRIDVRFEF